MLDAIVPLLGATALLLGLALATVGLYGLFRKPDIFEQLHAAGLVTGPGVILVLLASLAMGSAEIATSAGLVVAFVLVTSSLSAHAIALAAWRGREQARPVAEPAIRATPGSEAALLAEATPTPTRVLLAHDGSPDAEVAVGLVASALWPAGCAIRLVAVVEGDLPPLPSAGTERDERPGELLDLRAALEAAQQVLGQRGLAVDAVVRRGEPAAAVVEEATAFDAELVVVGSRGLGWARSMLLGSVAVGVVDGAPCPVLVARSASIREVLLAVDGTDASRGAIDVVARWAIFEAARIHVLSVAPVVSPYAETSATGAMHELVDTSPEQRIADAAAAVLRESGRHAMARVAVGDAPERILAAAGAERIDLIVLGSRGRTGLRRALLGSVGREVVSSAGTSVLVVKGAGL